MSEAVSSKPSTKPSTTGRRWLGVIGRIVVAVVMVLAVLGLLVNVAALVGVWTAYGPARGGVTDAGRPRPDQ